MACSIVRSARKIFMHVTRADYFSPSVHNRLRIFSALAFNRVVRHWRCEVNCSSLQTRQRAFMVVR